MQKKLENYFSVSMKHKENRKCFIYDPTNYKASFENHPAENDQFLSIKLGISLYYRPHSLVFLELPIVDTKIPVPLLKSNLQKAIRRCYTTLAIQTALAIIQKDHIELLRRLPIIYIEDVCLMDSYTIIVWLMMAEKEHVLDAMDIDILLHCIKSLCEYATYYDDSADYMTADKLSHEFIQDSLDEVIAVYYRSQYGGTKGDMKMLQNAVYYYKEHPSEIGKTEYHRIDYNTITNSVEILPEAIDFHPFPHLLTILQKKTRIEKDMIKEWIWFVESAVNIRKQHTMDKSNEMMETDEWKAIGYFLDNVRNYFMFPFI
jgi:hypothetical protein